MSACTAWPRATVGCIGWIERSLRFLRPRPDEPCRDLERAAGHSRRTVPDAVNSQHQILSLDGKRLIWWSHGGRNRFGWVPIRRLFIAAPFSPIRLRAISATARGG